MKRMYVLVLCLLLASPLEAKPARRHVAKRAHHSVTKVVPKKSIVPKTTVAKSTPITKVVKRPASARSGFVPTLTKILAGLKKTYAGAMDLIKSIYRPKEEELAIRDFDQLVSMTKPVLDNEKNVVREAELVQIPDPARYHIRLRLTGRDRIGEADRDPSHQVYYTYTRRYVAGALVELGSGLTHAKLDIPGVTRTYVFQRDLIHKIGLKAAVTDFPSHAMAIAADIGLINTPLPDVEEIVKRVDVMRSEGKIMVNPEAFQSKCLHIVPTPEYQPYFEQLYEKAAKQIVAN